MITLEIPQYSDEWYQARVGIPSASNFDKIITPKGEPSNQNKNYMYQLAGERLTGIKTETYQNASMIRGLELEEEARNLFKMVTDLEVKEVGLCYEGESKLFSCSPDGLLDDAGLEIKCPIIHTHVSYLLAGTIPRKYIPQIQGSMLVTGFDKWWFCSYYPGLPPLILRVKKDTVFVAKLIDLMKSFVKQLNETTEKLKALQ